MRLDKVRFCNINSLAGTWTVDFRDPELRDNGIFLITGRTGSGKSTLLDAVSIALYACTPRLDRLTTGGNEAMTRDRGECWSEVEFTVRGERFRSSWKQNRAGGRPDGKLQTPTMALCRIRPDGSEESVSETEKIADVKSRVEEVTGMTFENFTRSMVLAQGRFAEFLQAGKDQRSALLERITGTEIYSELSKLAFEREKESRIAFERARDQLEGITLLSDEERDARSEELRRTEEDLNRWKAERQALDDRLARMKALEDARRRAADADAALQKARAENDALEPLRRKLDADARAARLDAALSALDQAEKGLDAARTQRADLERALPGMRDAAESAKRLEKDRAEEAAATAGTLEGLQPALQQARELDSRIDLAAGERDRAAQARDGKAGDLRNHEKEAAAGAEALRKCRERLAQAGARLEERAADEILDREMSGLEARHGVLDEKRRAAAAREGELKKCRDGRQQALAARGRAEKKDAAAAAALAGATETLAQLHGDRNDLLGDMTPEDARALADGCRELDRAAEAWRGALDQARGLAGQRDAAADDVAALDAERTRLEQEERMAAGTRDGLQEQVNQQRRIVEQQRLIASLDDHRARLVAGEPCPCCGSLEHPWSSGAPAVDADEARLGELEAALERAAKAAGEAGVALARCRGQWETKRTHLEDLRRRALDAADGAQALLAQAAPLCRPLEQKAAQAHAAARLTNQAARGWDVLMRAAQAGAGAGQTLEAMKPAFDELRRAEKELARLVGEAADLEKKIAGAEKDVQKQEMARSGAAAALSQADEKLKAAEDALDRAGREAGDARAAAGRAEDAFREELKPLGLADRAGESDIVATLKRRLQDWRDARDDQKRLDGERQKLEQAAEVLAGNGKHVRDALAAAERELGDRQAKLAALTGERGSVLDGRPADEVENKARRLAADAAGAFEKARAAREAAERALESHTATLDAAREQERQAGERRDADRDEAGRQCRDQGFKDLDEAKAARMAADARREADGRVGAASRRLDAAVALLEQARSDEARLAEEGARETATREELEADRAGADDKADAAGKEAGRLKAQLDLDREARGRHAEQARLCGELQRRFDDCSLLSRLIGSADGKKFRVFAQALTFRRLVEQANIELRRLSDRYTLVQDSSDLLELQVHDIAMSDTRSIRNLSGGETFQVSLALALGLASFDSRESPLETMFLDEGFGTLDPVALDKAVDTLASLRQSRDGALIGIISHVEALEERIPTRIHLERDAGGRSRLTGPGCSGGDAAPARPGARRARGRKKGGGDGAATSRSEGKSAKEGAKGSGDASVDGAPA